MLQSLHFQKEVLLNNDSVLAQMLIVYIFTHILYIFTIIYNFTDVNLQLLWGYLPHVQWNFVEFSRMFRLGNSTADGNLTTILSSLFFIAHSWWQRCVTLPCLIRQARFSKHMEDSKGFLKTEVCMKGINFEDQTMVSII